jgi:threonine/homoserine efflux transporter RhtA
MKRRVRMSGPHTFRARDTPIRGEQRVIEEKKGEYPGMLAALEPVVAVAAGGLLLGEELAPSTVIGGTLVASGAVLAQARLTPLGR